MSFIGITFLLLKFIFIVCPKLVFKLSEFLPTAHKVKRKLIPLLES